MALVAANVAGSAQLAGNMAQLAIRDLYQACHMPPPVVAVARDPIEFGRLVRRSHRGWWWAWLFVPLMSGGLLGEAALGFARMPEFGLASGLSAVLIIPMLRAVLGSELGRRGRGARQIRQGLAMASIGLVAGGIELLRGQTWLFSIGYGGSTAAIWACLFFMGDLLRPTLARWRSRREMTPRLRIRHLMWGSVPANRSLAPRLLRALEEVWPDEPMRPRLVDDRWDSHDPAREEMRAALQAQIGRWRYFPPADPILGRSLDRWNATGRRLSQVAAHFPDAARLPRVLQAATVLTELTEAVSVFHGVAVVLPAGAPTSAVPKSAPGKWRRSRRDPWWAALRSLDEDDIGLALAIDLAPTEWLADKLLARQVARMPDARARGTAIAAMGLDRFMGALAPKRVQQDASGCLFQVGHSEDPSTFVEVLDRVVGPDGRPLRHWISVPPHMATAREAIAWSFGMNEAEYRPARES